MRIQPRVQQRHRDRRPPQFVPWRRRGRRGLRRRARAEHHRGPEHHRAAEMHVVGRHTQFRRQFGGQFHAVPPNVRPQRQPDQVAVRRRHDAVQPGPEPFARPRRRIPAVPRVRLRAPATRPARPGRAAPVRATAAADGPPVRPGSSACRPHPPCDHGAASTRCPPWPAPEITRSGGGRRWWTVDGHSVAVAAPDGRVHPSFGWITALTGANDARGARYDGGMVGRPNRWRRRVVMVDGTDTGVRPGIGSRLRRLTVQLLLTAGLAAIAWLLGSLVLGPGTASAAEPPTPTSPTWSASSSSARGDLLGTLAGSLTNTVTGLLGSNDVTQHAVHGRRQRHDDRDHHRHHHDDHGDEPDRRGHGNDRSGDVDRHPRTVHTGHSGGRARRCRPHANGCGTPGHDGPRRETGRAARDPPPGPGGTPARTVAAPVIAPKRPAAVRTDQHPHAPLPVPAPQPPSPALPATSVTVRPRLRQPRQDRRSPCTAPARSRTAPAASAGWSADPATATARSQALPTTSPD